ncbi:hypothetical protein ASPFODRAFT_57036 [Aspergillus luchuensis CBS 106.47]|uniref:D-xylulose reductase n=1 Tax=Aspergillus luchuensis (strain CBS 106.47) TaxID=1137211 RepID=A0A1M3TV71_ASPLC|nr:hypothetical protein ASPFODRAFT_57036 [Aspergillus luchuensis CBS 106.47]
MNPSTHNPSCVLYSPLDARFEDRPLPTLEYNPHDVLIRIAYTGVCGSDVHFWLHGGIRTYVSPARPLTMGHEASGIIHSIGTAVTILQPGDEVSIEPGYPCRRCTSCKSGRYNLCPEMKFAADPPFVHGTLTKYFRVPADFCYKEGRGIFGAGTVGLFCAAVAREFGASVVVSVDVVEERLGFARGFVGERVGRGVVMGRDLGVEGNVERILNEGRLRVIGGADVVIDASGAEMAVQTGVFVLKKGGTYMQAGMGKRSMEFSIAEMCEKEVVAKGCFRYGAGDFDLGVDLVRRGRVVLEGFISRVFLFEEATEAWEAAKRGEGIKMVIEGPR